MICTLHIGLNRFLLLIVGLWPYQQSKLVWFQLILYFGVVASFILCQFTTFITLKCTSDLFINVLSSSLFYIMFMVQYISFIINIKILKCILEQMQHMYNKLIDENEINIIEKYSNYAKRYTIACFLLYVTAILISTLYLFWHIFDIPFFTNGTQSHFSLPFMTEYFIDQEKYFYFILFHMYAAFVAVYTLIIATGTIFIVFVHYMLGMFRIARYRIERAMMFKTLRKNSLGNENLIYKRLICAVDMHRKAMKFSDLVVSTFKITISLLIIMGVISASLNLFRIFQMISFGYDITQILLPTLFSIILLVYSTISNYFAQEVMDYNNDIFITVYKIQWYEASLQIQKFILFLLQRGAKAFTMNIAGLFVGSLESIVMLINTALSYFTILYTVQH